MKLKAKGTLPCTFIDKLCVDDTCLDLVSSPQLQKHCMACDQDAKRSIKFSVRSLARQPEVQNAVPCSRFLPQKRVC